MDVFLRRRSNGNCIAPQNTNDLEQSIALQAKTPLELMAEVADLRKRRIGLVNVRRQQVMRLGEQSLLHVLSDNDIQVGTVGYAGGFTGSLGRSYEESVQDTYRALEMAATLSARSLVIVPGSQQKHIYSHASKTIKAGLDRCLDDALRFRIDLQIALDNIIRDRDDVFVPSGQSPLQWIEDMDSHRMKGMMVLRGASPWKGMPDCWRRCLLSGGILRLSRSCSKLVGANQVMDHIIQGLNNAPAIKKQSAAFSLPR
jgi:hypothetical protein